MWVYHKWSCDSRLATIADGTDVRVNYTATFSPIHALFRTKASLLADIS